jgi:hypothetical protein
MDVWNGNLRLDDSNEIRGEVNSNDAQNICLLGRRHTNKRTLNETRITDRLHSTVSLPCRYIANTTALDMRDQIGCLDHGC